MSHVFRHAFTRHGRDNSCWIGETGWQRRQEVPTFLYDLERLVVVAVNSTLKSLRLGRCSIVNDLKGVNA